MKPQRAMEKASSPTKVLQKANGNIVTATGNNNTIAAGNNNTIIITDGNSGTTSVLLKIVEMQEQTIARLYEQINQLTTALVNIKTKGI